MKVKIIILLTLLISGCGGAKTISRYSTLPELTIENKKSDRLIVDRKSDYGYNGRDGCVVRREILIEITELSDGKNINGKVLDAEYKTPLINAGILLYINSEGVNKPIETLSDKNGMFNIQFDGKLEKIIVPYVSYRTLKIDFNKL